MKKLAYVALQLPAATFYPRDVPSAEALWYFRLLAQPCHCFSFCRIHRAVARNLACLSNENGASICWYPGFFQPSFHLLCHPEWQHSAILQVSIRKGDNMKVIGATVCLLLLTGALTNHAAAQSWS